MKIEICFHTITNPPPFLRNNRSQADFPNFPLCVGKYFNISITVILSLLFDNKNFLFCFNS